jgi:hypothetical protein
MNYKLERKDSESKFWLGQILSNLHNMNSCTSFSRTLIRSALRWSNATVETIESDLILCACTKEYLRQVGQKIDQLEQWELDLISGWYQQITGNISPVVKLRLDQIGIVINEYIHLNLQELDRK